MVVRISWMLQWRNIKETLMSKINEVDIGEAGDILGGKRMDRGESTTSSLMNQRISGDNLC